MKKKILPSLRISEATFEKLEVCLDKINQDQIVPLTMNQLRRLAYENLIITINKGELPKVQV